jgi:hypothetical protein
MKLQDIISGVTIESFQTSIIDKAQIKLYQNAFDPSQIDHANRLKNIVLNPKLIHNLSINFNRQYIQLSHKIKNLNEFYKEVALLFDEDLWKFIVKKGEVLRFRNFISDFPELNELKSDLIKSTARAINSYLVVSTDTEDSPLGHHSDPIDIIILQFQGSKKWNFAVDENNQPIRQWSKNLPFDPSNKSQKYLEIVTKPGDVLFIPYQTPHFVQPVEDKASIHATVGIERNSVNEFQSYIMATLKDHLMDEKTLFELRDDYLMYKDDIQNFKTKLDAYLKKFDSEEIYNDFVNHLDEKRITNLKIG